MATKPIITGTRLTIAEFLDLPDTEERNKMELDDGELYIMPRPRPLHQFLLYWLGWHIANYIQSFGEPPAEVYPDVVVILSREPRRVLAPDLAIILAGNPYRIIVGGYFEGVPDIVRWKSSLPTATAISSASAGFTARPALPSTGSSIPSTTLPCCSNSATATMFPGVC